MLSPSSPCSLACLCIGFTGFCRFLTVADAVAEAAAALAEPAAALSLGLLQPGCFSPQFRWLWHSFRGLRCRLAGLCVSFTRLRSFRLLAAAVADPAAEVAEPAAASRFGLLQPGCFLPQFHWLWHRFAGFRCRLAGLCVGFARLSAVSLFFALVSDFLAAVAEFPMQSLRSLPPVHY